MTQNQSISATSKYIRISPSKVDLIIKQIRGKTYKQALQILKYLPQKSGAIVWQTLYSAVSNATNNFDLEKEIANHQLKNSTAHVQKTNLDDLFIL